ADVADFPEVLNEHSELLDGRAMWVKKAEVIPIECVARGYLSGSAWRSYKDCGEICGHKLPDGLRESDRLPEPIFTPATKAKTGHDENITCEMCARLVGSELANWLEKITLRLYIEAADYLDEHGLILADTKFEFGLIDGDVTLIDEALTPDSSRYWDKDLYQPGQSQDSLDKQPVRNYLDTLDWDKKPPAPELPADIVADTRRRYREIYRRITGQPLD
ncbi:MAG: phosphoribosylaminoimidazolesuccinocarboxamide synthase, partial [Armatimonadota bacterium]